MMFTVVIDTGGNIGDCDLQIVPVGYGGWLKCMATKTWCVIHKDEKRGDKKIRNLKCPFDEHNVVQFKYRKNK